MSSSCSQPSPTKVYSSSKRKFPNDRSSPCSATRARSLGKPNISPLGLCLYQPVTVEQYCLAGSQNDLLLLIAHPRHESQGHPSGPQLLAITTMPQVGQVVARVCVHQGTALRVEDGTKAGYEHVGWDTCQHCLVDPRQYLSWRGAQGCGYASEQGARRAHHESRWHSLTRCVSHGEAYPAVI